MLGNVKSNLTTVERNSLQNLKRNKSIVIKPADKGSATVVMNKTAYLAEAYRQLNNERYYRKLDRPIYHENIAKINSILKSMETK